MKRKNGHIFLRRAFFALFVFYLAWFGIDIKLGGIHFWTNPLKDVFGV